MYASENTGANRLDQLRQKKHKILQTTDKYGASNIRLFGSIIRNEATFTSDVDMLIHVNQDSGLSLFGLAKLQEELEQLIGYPVDLVLDDTLHPVIGERILQEALPL